MEVDSCQRTLLSRLAEGAAEVAGAAAAEGAHGVDARAAVLTGARRALVHVRLTPRAWSHTDTASGVLLKSGHPISTQKI